MSTSTEPAPTPRPKGLYHFGEVLKDRALKHKKQALIFLPMLILSSFFFESSPANGIIFCPYKLFTGIDCPGCGMTRSWVSIVAGDLQAAVHFNPFGPVLFGLAFFKTLFLGIEVKSKRWLVIPAWEKIRVPVMGAVAVGMMSLGIYRLVLFFS